MAAVFTKRRSHPVGRRSNYTPRRRPRSCSACSPSRRRLPRYAGVMASPRRRSTAGESKRSRASSTGSGTEARTRARAELEKEIAALEHKSPTAWASSCRGRAIATPTATHWWKGSSFPLKREEVWPSEFDSFSQALAAVQAWIDDYNGYRSGSRSVRSALLPNTPGRQECNKHNCHQTDPGNADGKAEQISTTVAQGDSQPANRPGQPNPNDHAAQDQKLRLIFGAVSECNHHESACAREHPNAASSNGENESQQSLRNSYAQIGTPHEQPMQPTRAVLEPQFQSIQTPLLLTPFILSIQ
jgi:hypothetical protein